jgi:hypothetical protein
MVHAVSVAQAPVDGAAQGLEEIIAEMREPNEAQHLKRSLVIEQPVPDRGLRWHKWLIIGKARVTASFSVSIGEKRANEKLERVHAPQVEFSGFGGVGGDHVKDQIDCRCELEVESRKLGLPGSGGRNSG